MKSSERSLSVWESTNPQHEFPPLTGDATADVVIVGAGIAGMSVAYHLAKAGGAWSCWTTTRSAGAKTGQTTPTLPAPWTTTTRC